MSSPIRQGERFGPRGPECRGSYDRVKLGQEPRDYERAFPAESARRTHLGLCSLCEDAFGRTDAVVVLTTLVSFLPYFEAHPTNPAGGK